MGKNVTKYGQRAAKDAKSEENAASIGRISGHVSMIGAGVSAATGDLPMVAAGVASGSFMYGRARVHDERASAGRAKGNAVEDMVTRSRGGSNVGSALRLTPEQHTQYRNANAHFETQRHAAGLGADAHAAMRTPGGSGKGFGNKNNQDAAQAARKAKRGQ